MMRLFIFFDTLVISIGRVVHNSFLTAAEFIKFFINACKNIPYAFKNFHFSVEQMYLIGITSIPLVATTSVFTGGVLAIQSITQFGDYLPLRYAGMVVGKSVLLELGPVLTGLVVAGRVGAAMAAELGTMAVTEQLDAMRCLNLNPFRVLIAPRLLAGMVMLPVLTIYSSFVSILGALVILIILKDLPPAIFFSGVRIFYSDLDMLVGLLKALVFGIIITAFGCFYGYHSTHGADGVGKATRSSVVASDITILVSGYVVSFFLLKFIP